MISTRPYVTVPCALWLQSDCALMPRILVAGELNADLILSGLPSLPVLGRELLGTNFVMVLGSSSAITAARLAALGADNPTYAVDFVGLVGRDDIGRFVLQQLETFGVRHESVRTVDVPTGVTISLPYERDRALLTVPGAMAVFDGAVITADLLAHYTHLHVGSFFLQTNLQPQLARIFALARGMGLTTSLDTGWDPNEAWMDNPFLAPTLAETDEFLPNEDECAALAASPEALWSRVGGTLWVKRGGHGASAYTADQTTHAPAFQVEPADTTGAGDAFNAGALYARHILNEPIEAALRFASACGAEAVQHVGGATAAPSEAFIRAWIAQQTQQP